MEFLATVAVPDVYAPRSRELTVRCSKTVPRHTVGNDVLKVRKVVLAQTAIATAPARIRLSAQRPRLDSSKARHKGKHYREPTSPIDSPTHEGLSYTL